MKMDDKILSYAMLFCGIPKSDIKLLYQLILQMITCITEGEEADADEFSLLVEEAAGNRPVSVNHAKELVEKAGCFVFDGKVWRYNDTFKLKNDKVAWEQFLGLFLEEKDSYKKNGIMDPEKEAIIRGIEWCVHMVQLAGEEGMEGLPAFLRCGEQDSLIGKKVAGTATSDALSLLCNGIDYIRECEIEPKMLASSFTFLVEQVLGCQYRGDGWDKGGFFSLEDQPGAEHPTVDTTCLAIMALCDFYSNRSSLEEKLHVMVGIASSEIEDAVLDGLEFLFCMQQPEGSYGIYKYEEEYPDGINLDRDCRTGTAESNENCTRMVLSTMGVCKGSGIFDARKRFDLYGKCSECIQKSYGYLKNHMAESDEVYVWAPYFGEKARDYPYGDIIASSARVCRSLIPVWWQCEEEREQIKKYYSDFLIFWKQEEQDVRGRYGIYTFKTPGKDKYTIGTYTWESYSDMIAAFTVLQGYNLFGMALTREDWKILESVIHEVMRMQHPHGHWNKPSGGNPFCAVTLAAIELLKEYRIAKGLE